MKRSIISLFLLAALAASGCGGEQPEPVRVSAPAAEKSAFARGDYETAFVELKPLADQGDIDAAFRVGFMYTHGQGVPQDLDEAIRWVRKAAEAGHPEAQYNMGLNYELGRGVVEDIVQAHVWFTLASSQGYRAARQMRDDTSERMTPEQIAEARKQAVEMMPKE